MSRQLSILHVMAPGAAGGLETVVQLLATGQRRAGHAVHVAAVVERADAEFPGLSSLRSDGVDVVVLPLPGRAYRRERRTIAELCGRVRPSVVHTHGYRPDVVDAGVARRLGIATVTTVHGFTGGGWRNRLYERLQYAAFRRFDAVVAVSRPLVRQLEAVGVAPPRLHLVPNAYGGRGAPLDREAARRRLGLTGDAFRLGWVGRLSREKGPDVLVRAVPHLRDLPLAVSVLGNGADRARAATLARELGVAERITWHGTVPDAAALFAAFDAFALSSRTEGTPMALFEAMAAAVPVVATSVGGVPDVVGPSEALLVPPEDPAALAAAVRATFDDRAAAAARAAAARRRLAAEFGVEPWVAHYDAIYHAVRRDS
jgi:glycosyltransferase involved in cell wall biosynthesis